MLFISKIDLNSHLEFIFFAKPSAVTPKRFKLICKTGGNFLILINFFASYFP